MRLVAIVIFIKSMPPYICHRLLRDCVIQGFLNTINSAIEFLTKERYLFLFLEADYLDIFTVEAIIASKMGGRFGRAIHKIALFR